MQDENLGTFIETHEPNLRDVFDSLGFRFKVQFRITVTAEYLKPEDIIIFKEHPGVAILRIGNAALSTIVEYEIAPHSGITRNEKGFCNDIVDRVGNCKDITNELIKVFATRKYNIETSRDKIEDVCQKAYKNSLSEGRVKRCYAIANAIAKTFKSILPQEASVTPDIALIIIMNSLNKSSNLTCKDFGYPFSPLYTILGRRKEYVEKCIDVILVAEEDKNLLRFKGFFVKHSIVADPNKLNSIIEQAHNTIPKSQRITLPFNIFNIS